VIDTTGEEPLHGMIANISKVKIEKTDKLRIVT
jgi:hypothetical protein